MTTQIEFTGDPSCPFCYLGFERFIRARAEFDDNVLDVTIRPFFINPDLPSNGLEYQSYLLARFGEQAAIAAELVPFQKGTAEDDIPLNIDRIKIMPSTQKAQRLLHWARDVNADVELFRAMQAAHFVNGQDIGSDAVLRAMAESIGMDGPAVVHMLSGHLDDDLVTQKARAAIKAGVKEVPTWIIGGTYAVTGVQTINFWRNVIGEIDEKGRELATKTLN